MRQHVRKLAVVLAVILGVMGLAQGLAEEGSRGILYRVNNGEATVYLLGSIHVGNETMYPFGETLQAAMAASDIFVFECDAASPQAMEIAKETMYFTDGTKLKDVVSEELYAALGKACKKTGRSLRGFETMKPWAVMTQLSMDVTAAEMGIENVRKSVEWGVESMVQSFAAENQKQVQYLETTQEQLGNFDRMTMPLQVYLLDQSVNAILHPEGVTGMEASIQEWPSWWREGNWQAFAQGYLAGYLEEQKAQGKVGLLGEYHQLLISSRNEAMANAIEAYLNAPETSGYFVTVGLLHLVLEDDSIVTRLKERGYEVEYLSAP